MTRILYLTEEPIQFTDPMVRGGAIHVRNVVAGLRERGHEVKLIDWNRRPDRSFQHSVAPHSRFVDGPLRTIRRATAIGHEMGAEVLVSKTRKTYLPSLIAARRLGVPHVVHVGSSLEPRVGIGNWLSAQSFALQLRAPHDAYFVVCEAIASELQAHGIPSGRIWNVKNAVDIDRFSQTPSDPDAAQSFSDRHEQTMGESDLTLGYVGGLHDYKGLADLAVAMDHCEADVSLLIAGDGPERDALETAFGAAATFLGPVPYDEIPAVYQAMDIFVLPSHTEGLPRVVLEAQVTATPVVATRVGGVPEVITDGETGLLCDPHDPAGLAATIQRLATAPDERERLGSNGRAAVEATYSWDALYDRYETYLSDLVDANEEP